MVKSPMAILTLAVTRAQTGPTWHIQCPFPTLLLTSNALCAAAMILSKGSCYRLLCLPLFLERLLALFGRPLRLVAGLPFLSLSHINTPKRGASQALSAVSASAAYLYYLALV